MNGDVQLYYDNALRFSTASSGVKLYSLPQNCGNGFTLFYHSSTGQVSFHNRFRNVIPESDDSYDLGSTSLRWQNIYTNDLNLSNEGGANDVDGTWGSYTIQEGAEDLFLINKRSGKKYKFNLTEVS